MLGKLREVSGNVRAVLDKLNGIKADLVRDKTGSKSGILANCYK